MKKLVDQAEFLNASGIVKLKFMKYKISFYKKSLFTGIDDNGKFYKLFKKPLKFKIDNCSYLLKLKVSQSNHECYLL